MPKQPTEPGGAGAKIVSIGLDEILGGGHPPNRVTLLEGPPGSGKTTAALQFLEEGRRERVEPRRVFLDSRSSIKCPQAAGPKCRPVERPGPFQSPQAPRSLPPPRQRGAEE